ncbi:MAG: sn-glycerol-3-phosphate ABC transporter ATP-binding protein UgpC [Desulfobacterales bacterium]|nr:sn-glycerol-3-phosphate ABC transporter ATP-binding protein UgpC [Desulfobacterales bacterium]MCP4160471.1 sn-glycerol-3-phosphate ABC transporter ATP-binding protein UgpC [Deltaproteobacteria bacterium]
MARVALKNLVKKYGKTQVVHSINLDIKDREFIVFVGPSGCGKSTTLRMIAGLEEISGGEITIEDKVVNDIEPKNRDVAMVFQNYALYPHMNVFENMSFGLKISKVPKKEIEERVQEAANILGLEDFLKRKPSELSGGQRQRVAMGRAIVRNPKIFLFDEPLSNLDAKLRGQMRVEMKKLHQRVKSTIIYVTHDQVEAMTLGDRIVVMRDGIIEQVGNPIELFQEPVNTFVAGFIGNPSMNLEPCIIEEKDSSLFLKFESGLSIPIPDKDGVDLKTGSKVIMGLRTEDLFHGNGEEKIPAEWKFSGEVDVVEPLGSETYMHMNIMGTALTARCDGRKIFKPGDKIELCANLKHLHIFDGETQNSIY